MLYYEYKFTWGQQNTGQKIRKTLQWLFGALFKFFFFLCGGSLTAGSDVNVVFFFVVVSGSFASGLH